VVGAVSLRGWPATWQPGYDWTFGRREGCYLNVWSDRALCMCKVNYTGVQGFEGVLNPGQA
jgi:hypothetical protein